MRRIPSNIGIFSRNLIKIIKGWDRRTKQIYSRVYISGAITFLLIDVFVLINTYVLKTIVDKGFTLKDIESILYLAVLSLLSSCLFVVIAEVRNYFQRIFAEKISYHSKTQFTRSIMRLKMEFFGETSVGDIVTRIDDSLAVNDLVAIFIFDLLKTVFQLLFATVAALMMNWKLAIVLFIFIPIHSCISVMNAKYQKQREPIRWSKETSIKSSIIEILTNIEFIRVQVLEAEAIQNIEKKTRDIIMYDKETYKKMVYRKVLSGWIFHWETFTTIIATGIMFFSGMITLGSWIAFQALSQTVKSPLMNLLQLQEKIKLKTVSLERYEWLLSQPIESQKIKQIHITNGDITVKNLSFQYSNRKQIFSDISLSIENNEFVLITGPSGTGKTTLIKLLLGICAPQVGSICYDKQDISEYNIRSLRKQVGVVLQDPYMFNETIYSNLTLGLTEISNKKIIDACQMAGIWGQIKELPSGLYSRIEEGGSNFSRGEKQRLAYARVLLKNPPILLLDEPTSSLDSDSQEVILSSLISMKGKKTIIMVAHKLVDTSFADKVIHLANGTCLEI